ncbi:dihydroorotase [Dyadobacter sandarakinus]|uniref:Dihydroorotase n=1 Tax=Dyadobacter sandarakinus TaxID=2747268 RepID=A0ABX7IA36_9BACT|nr:dihydroorotase [Dyadobacter sandarakinus]QRR02964.1 dihydroorotase [Dyadobacter sandarakinus]
MSTLIVNARVVNENSVQELDVLIENGHITKIGSDLQSNAADRVIDARGKYLMPGVIDDQVHFREPGLTHKANIYMEARAAVAGGVTSFMEMPNTVPNTLTQPLLQDKYDIAAATSLANYSFFMGASNSNYDEVMKTDVTEVCGIKIFMGSSTGNMLVDAPEVLEKLFANAPCLIATHCEDEPTVRQRMELYREMYGENVPYNIHALIRNEEACLKSSSFATSLAHKNNTRLHILHISTGDEVFLFEPGNRSNGQILLSNGLPKLVTAEACVHHLWFDAEDYHNLGNKIKCNPAIKAPHHKEAILQAVLDNRIDVIATDHAPHTMEEKKQHYWQAPSGLPLVQHTLNVMLELSRQGKISIERVVEKMSHAVADCFQIRERGYIREGYWADLILVDTEATTTVSPDNIESKCGWSPFEGTTFHSQVTHTFVSGHLAFENGKFDESIKGKRLNFSR